MGLFVKREDTTLAKGFYVLQGGIPKLVVGLGNVGPEYTLNRHNIGFMVLDDIAEKNGARWTTKKDLKCELAEVRLGEHKVYLIKPTTMMNLSGESVSAVQRFYRLNNATTAVVYDEVDLLFGQVRGRVGGSSGGHNGVKSIIKHLGDDITRIRIGIANEHREKTETADFVLANFSRAEQQKLPSIISLASEQVSNFARGEFKHHTSSDNS